MPKFSMNTDLMVWSSCCPMGSFVVESLLAIVLFSLAQRLGGNDLSIKRLRYRKAWFTAEILARVIRSQPLMVPRSRFHQLDFNTITITVWVGFFFGF